MNRMKEIQLSPAAFLEGGAFLGPMASTVIQNLPVGVVCFRTDLKIIDSNRFARQMLHEASDIVEALSSGTDPQINGQWAPQLKQSLVSGETCAFNEISYHKNGRKSILQVTCSPLMDSQTRESLGGVLVINDVTMRRGLANDLAEAERLAAVGKLAARVAHELNNPLDGILRYINLTLRVIDSEKPAEASRYLQESRKGLLRMVQIISELLEFSRSTYSAFEEADINKIVEDAAHSMEHQASEAKVELSRHYGTEMPNVRSGNLYQVFLNLIKNAIDAMEGGGRLDITTRREKDAAVMEFADTGMGLSEEVLQKMFEPFFTTKTVGKGTGLGLAICKDIIERYGGQIEAGNRAEGGSVFTVRIPVERGHQQSKN
jgi:signal transduction histidine kinase